MTNKEPSIGFKIIFACICLALIMGALYVGASSSYHPIETKTFDVVDVSIYSYQGGFTTFPDNGYLIRYLDGDKIITLEISSRQLDVKSTTNESYLVMRCGDHWQGCDYELFWNISEKRSDCHD